MISLKQIRETYGYSQSELARRIGIKQQQYARYEKGVTKITLEMFLKILDVGNYTIEIKNKNTNLQKIRKSV